MSGGWRQEVERLWRMCGQETKDVWTVGSYVELFLKRSVPETQKGMVHDGEGVSLVGQGFGGGSILWVHAVLALACASTHRLLRWK